MRKNESSNRRKLIDSYDKKTIIRIQYVQARTMIRTKLTYTLSSFISVTVFFTAEKLQNLWLWHF